MSRHSFWKLLAERRLVISRIQRDYAQGRGDRRTSEVRQAFVESINNALRLGASDPLDLGLIFGSPESDTDRAGDWIILDGQQRLTTLFLLHWYLMPEDCWSSGKTLLQKFSYETRVSSRDFCRELADHPGCRPQESTKAEKGSELSASIKDQHWFQSPWDKDPTVQGMLIMLDAIHTRLQVPGRGDTGLWKRLIGVDAIIHFDCLDLQEQRLPDETYVRLNDRGRALTDFENFKAWLEKENCKGLAQEWMKKLDTTWLHLFWKGIDAKEKESGNIDTLLDKPMLAFFHGMALNARCATGKDGAKDTIDRVTGKDYLTKEDLKSLYPDASAEKTPLPAIFSFLDFLSGSPAWFLKCLGEPWLNQYRGSWDRSQKGAMDGQILRGWETRTLDDRVLAFAAVRFVLGPSADGCAEDRADALSAWMRLMRNWVANSSLSKEGFANAIQTVSKLADSLGLEMLSSSKELFQKVATLDEFQPKSLDGTQWKEEFAKAKLKSGDDSWIKRLVLAEDHPFFRGRIQFLLTWSESDANRFESYWQKVELIFRDDENVPFASWDRSDDEPFREDERENAFLLHRAMLAKGDFLGEARTNFTWGRNAEEWRTTILGDKDRAAVLKSLLDCLDPSGDSSLPEQMQSIVCHAKMCHAKTEIPNWRVDFIHCPEAIRRCSKGKIRFNDLEDGKGGDWQILLLNTNQTNGYHAELRTYRFFIEKLKRMAKQLAPLEVHYIYSASVGTLPSALLCRPSGDAPQLKISVEFDANGRETPWRIRVDQSGGDCGLDSLRMEVSPQFQLSITNETAGASEGRLSFTQIACGDFDRVFAMVANHLRQSDTPGAP